MDWLVWKGFGPTRNSARVFSLLVLFHTPFHAQSAVVDSASEKKKVNLLLLETLPLPPAQLSKVREISSVIREENSSKILQLVGKGVSKSLESRSASGKYDSLLGFAVTPSADKQPPIRGESAGLKSAEKNPSMEFRYSVDFTLDKENSPAITNGAFLLIRSGLLEVGVKSRVNVEASLMADVNFKERSISVPMRASGAGTLTGFIFGLPVGIGYFRGSYESEMCFTKETQMTMTDHNFFMAGVSVFGAGFYCSWGRDNREVSLSIYTNPFSGSVRSEVEKEFFSGVKSFVRYGYTSSHQEFGYGVKFNVWSGGWLEAGTQYIWDDTEPDRLFLVTLRSSF